MSTSDADTVVRLRETPRRRSSRRRGPLEESPELSVHRRRRRQRRKHVAAGIGIVVLAVVGGLGIWAYSFAKGLDRDMVEKEDYAPMVEELTPVEVPGDPFYMLLLGVDSRGEANSRADTIVLAKVDPKEKRVWLVSIPRDTRAEIPDHGVNKINAAHFYGGPALTIQTVEDLMGIEINHYMEVDFTGFVSVVDALGGVYIDVPSEIDDRKAASHSPGARAKHIDAGYQLLDGEHALTFVRSRDYPDADFTRMKNQQSFFRAMAKQAMELQNIGKLPSVVKEFYKATLTDLTVGDVLKIASDLSGMDPTNIQTATLLGTWKSPYVWPDEEVKEKIINALLTNGDIERRETSATAVYDPAEITVSVRNGAGIGGVAAEAADMLELDGYDVVEVGNANQFVYDRTLVVYRDDKPAAEQIAQLLPIADVIPSNGMYLFDSDILVVVGKDWPEAYAQIGR